MLSLSPIRDIFPLFPESTFVFLRDLVVVQTELQNKNRGL